MVCVLLNNAIGVEITHIPYRGTAPAMQDLIGGRVDYLCDIISTAIPPIQAGTVKPLAILSSRRNAALPDLATADEQGLKGFDVDAWNAFFFPKGTPDAIVRRLAKATSEVVDIPAVAKRLQEIGLQVAAPERRNPDYVAKLVKTELETWRRRCSRAAPQRNKRDRNRHICDRGHRLPIRVPLLTVETQSPSEGETHVWEREVL